LAARLYVSYDLVLVAVIGRRFGVVLDDHHGDTATGRKKCLFKRGATKIGVSWRSW
jgi:hypothetical protein